MIYNLVQFKIIKRSLNFEKMFLFGMWIVYKNLVYIYQHKNGNDLWFLEMNRTVWSDSTDSIEMVYNQYMKMDTCFCVRLFWYADHIYILESMEQIFVYDYFPPQSENLHHGLICLQGWYSVAISMCEVGI